VVIATMSKRAFFGTPCVIDA